MTAQINEILLCLLKINAGLQFLLLIIKQSEFTIYEFNSFAVRLMRY